jgi:thiamine biosynthesis lipoprotein
MRASAIFSRAHWLLAAAAVLLVAGCSDRIEQQQHQHLVFGTTIDVTVRDTDKASFDRAVAAIDADFDRMHRELHAWKTSGALTDLNAAIAAGKAHDTTPEIAALLAQASELSRRSDYLFNPAIGRLIALWGFHSDERPTGPPPAATAISKLVAQHPQLDQLTVDTLTVRSRNRAVQIDLGAFAKGYAVERAMAMLRQHGIRDAIVNAGGDLCTMGKNGNRPWRVGIRHWHGEGIAAAVKTQGNEAVFTSGNYERFREYNDRRYAHIIDPRTGYPVDHVVSVTVIHNDGAVADAAATALVVAGPKDWHRIARQMGIHYVMLVDADSTIYMNPEMVKRMEFPPDNKYKIVISEPL